MSLKDELFPPNAGDDESKVAPSHDMDGLYKLVRARAEEYFQALGAYELLDELRRDVLAEKYNDVEDLDVGLDTFKWENYLDKKDGRGNLPEGIDFGIGFSFDKRGEDPEICDRFLISAVFKLERRPGGIGILQREAKVSVSLIRGGTLDTDYRNVRKKGEPKAQVIYLPAVVDDLMTKCFRQAFVRAYGRPFIVVPHERSLSSFRYFLYEEGGGRDFRLLPALRRFFASTDSQQSLEDGALKLGAISHRVGALLIERYGILETIMGMSLEGSQVVHSSEEFGDLYMLAIRWDIGEFQDYAGKEVIVAVKPREDDLRTVREGTFESGTCKVLVGGAKQNILTIDIPIGRLDDLNFINWLTGSLRTLRDAMKQSLANPRRAASISSGSIASSAAHIRSVLGQPPARVTGKHAEGGPDVEDGGDIQATLGSDRGHAQNASEVAALVEEEEAWHALEEQDPIHDMVPESEAHGEVNWSEGTGIDEAGQEIYPEGD